MGVRAMGREDVLRGSKLMTSRMAGPIPVPSKMQLGGSYFAGDQGARLMMGRRPAMMGQARLAIAPQYTPSTPASGAAKTNRYARLGKEEASHLLEVLTRVIDKMQARGQNPVGVRKVRDRIAAFLQTAGPQDALDLTPEEVQVLDTSVGEMDAGPAWSTWALVGGAALAVGAAIYYFTR